MAFLLLDTMIVGDIFNTTGGVLANTVVGGYHDEGLSTVNTRMQKIKRSLFIIAGLMMLFSSSIAHATYWNVFNVESESSLSSAIVTYDTMSDMLNDTNRAGLFAPDSAGFGHNVVGSGSDGESYWNVFNIENESLLSAVVVTYSTFEDMLLDSNRKEILFSNSVGFGHNVVGSGADLLIKGTPKTVF